MFNVGWTFHLINKSHSIHAGAAVTDATFGTFNIIIRTPRDFSKEESRQH